MVVTDPSIDPITGLPVLNPSGPVQQIPLGQEVFPYADLNATAQPTRGPIYGDDIIPTSGLVTAPDKQMKPRSIQSTTTRELRTREAVFQNLGAAIPDGTTAPIDVNVVSGGGGGGGKLAGTTYQVWAHRSFIAATNTTFTWNFGVIKTIYTLDVSVTLEPAGGFDHDSVIFELVPQPHNQAIYGCSLALMGSGTDGSGTAAASFNIMFPTPLDMTAYPQTGTGNFITALIGTFLAGGRITMGLTYD